MVGYDHPDAVTLVTAVQRVYVERYGGVDATPVDPSEFALPAGLFLVGYADGLPLTCGGWRLHRAVPRDGGPEEPPPRDGRLEEPPRRDCGTEEPPRRDGGTEEPPRRDGDAELKRMYVAPAARGRGFARLLLAELERTASVAGARRMVLETGTRQPEAIALYRSSGYRPMPRFGIYREAPGSRCFAKPLG